MDVSGSSVAGAGDDGSRVFRAAPGSGRRRDWASAGAGGLGAGGLDGSRAQRASNTSIPAVAAAGRSSVTRQSRASLRHECQFRGFGLISGIAEYGRVPADRAAFCQRIVVMRALARIAQGCKHPVKPTHLQLGQRARRRIAAAVRME